MARNDKIEYQIEDPEQISELVSPVRMELMDAMAGIGPASIAELAEELGRPADSLYYHVRKLVRCRLLLEIGTRERAGRTEAVFDVPSQRMALSHDHSDEARMLLIANASSAMLRLTDRNLRSALLSGQDTGNGTRRIAWAGRSRAWLSTKDIQEVNRLIAKIADIYFAAERRKDTTLHSFAVALAPIPIGRRSRQEEEDGLDEPDESDPGTDGKQRG